MQVRGRMRVKSEPCHGCGEVRELVGEYPEWIMLCYPCQGRFICKCCGVADSEYKGRPEEYKGDPDEYACPYCRNGCPYDEPEGLCRFAPE